MACHRDDMWSMDEKRKLTWLWGSGLSAKIITKHIRGRTRNAIIGQAHRLGLAKRLSPIRRRKSICARKGCGRELAVLSKRKYCSDQCSVKRERPDPIPLAVKELVPIPLYRDDKILATFSPTGHCVIDECNYLALNERCYKHNGAELGQP